MSRGQDVKSRLAAYRSEKQVIKTSREEKSNTKFTSAAGSGEENLQLLDEAPVKTNWWIFGLKILLWILIWGFFIEVEFGLVYFVVSALVFLVVSLRGGRKRASGELSAYSVFNKNFESIQGTLSAEQFERELRYGPSSVK